jgi:hypothetical protein
MTTCTKVGAAVVLSGLLLGCGDRGAPISTSQSDSTTKAPVSITVDSVPLWSVVEADPRDSVRFAFRTLITTLLLANGNVAVASGYELVYFDSGGRALRRVGRRGDGPGEFTSVGGLFHSGGGLGVWDASGKFLRYSGSGDFLREAQAVERARSAAGWLDGVGPVIVRGSLQGPREYILHDSTGTVLRTVSEMPALPSLRVGGESPSVECTPRYFEAVVGRTLHVADQPSGTVKAISADGATRSLFTSVSRRRITPEIIAFFRRNYESLPADSLNEAMRRFGNVGDPLPYTWDAMLPDPQGRLWLRIAECDLASIRGDREWEVIDSVGALVGTHRSRHLFRAVLGDRAIVVSYDSLDRPHVKLMRVRIGG